MVRAGVENGNGVKVVNELFEFLEAAKRQGRYPDTTAAGIRAALRLVSSVLTDEESTSHDTFRNNLDVIFQRVFNKNKTKLSALSLQTYRSKVNMVLSDYERYGRDPQAMAGWKRKTRAITATRSSKATRQSSESGAEKERFVVGESAQSGSAMTRLELPLRPNGKAILLIPSDLSTAEAKRIKTLVDACVKTE